MNVASRKRYGALAVILSALLMVLAGCGGSKATPKAEEPAPAAAAAPSAPAAEGKQASPAPGAETSFSVAGTSKAALKHVPLFLSSFGKTTNLKPDFHQFKGGSQVAKALREGKVDFAIMAVEHVLKDQSGEMKAVALITKVPGLALVVDAEYKDKIKSVADLKGQKVGVSTLGSGPHQFLNTLLTQAKIDPNAVLVSPVGLNAPEVFKAKKVVAMVTLEPYISQVTKGGQGFVLVDTRNSKGVKAVYGQDEMPWIALVTRQNVIEQKADMVQKVVSEFVKAQKYLTTAGGKDVVGMVPADISGDADLFATMIEANQDAFSADGMLNKASIESVWQSLQNTGTVPKDKPLPWDAVVDLRFLKNAPK